MNKYKVVSDVPLGRGGEGLVLEVMKKEGQRGEGQAYVMKQRLCFTLEDANNALSEVCLC
jgi:hypothetical protein